MSIIQKKREQLAKAEELLDRYDSARTLTSRQKEMRDELAAEIIELKAELAGPAPGALTVGGFGGSRSSAVGAPGNGFRSFGEQLQAIARSSAPNAQVDPRLYEIRAAATGLSESVNSEGGFLVRQDFSDDMLRMIYQTSPIIGLCRNYQITNNSNSLKLNAFDETSRASTRFGGVLGYWADEAAEKTASKPSFRQILLNLHKLTGLCYATDENLADATVLESVIRTAFVEELKFQVQSAIISGTGVGQPLGILNSGALVSVSKEAGQKAATIVAENIFKMWARLLPGSEANAVWLINKNILPQLFSASVAVGTGGSPIYLPANAIAGTPFQTLMGRPVIAIEQCPSLGTVGDIILADMNGYILATKGGIQSDMSIHVRFVFDESDFRFVFRLDGCPALAAPLTPHKGSDTQSFFVALETRS